MKNLLHPTAKTEILERINRLTPENKALWGKMNVMQGMRHMALALDIPTGKLDPTIAKAPPMPKWLMKFFLLNMKAPKEKAETFKELDTVANNINPADFAMERDNLRKSIEAFGTQGNFIPENKLGGKFSRDDWGKLSYNHTDHHLRQFGV